jgi:hypothetical protein
MRSKANNSAIAHMSCTHTAGTHALSKLAECQMNISFVYMTTIEIINLSAGKVREFTGCAANEIGAKKPAAHKASNFIRYVD